MQFDIETRVPPFVRCVMDALERSGHRGYLVGGSLRDLLRGEVPNDYDLTTDATPEEMMEIFSDFRVIPTGIRHGTLTVLSQGEPVEVTTHRLDGNYLDSRRPESVSFTKRLSEDLARRDFTVNAMAWHPACGLVDLFSGQEDLQNGVIRAVGDPTIRFTEDALRILRAFRFCAKLDFCIEPQTLAAAAAVRAGLERISAERIFSEIKRTLQAPAAARGLRALLDTGCATVVFPNTVLRDDRLAGLAQLPCRAELRLAFLLAGEYEENARALCRAWKAPNAFTDSVCGILAALELPLPDDAYQARRFVCTHWPHWQDALLVRGALGEDVQGARMLCKSVAKNGTAIELRRLAVSGRELQELGVRPARTGLLLRRLQELCWQEPTRNKKAILLELAAAILAAEKDFI